jgi:hypothetical protein
MYSRRSSSDTVVRANSHIVILNVVKNLDVGAEILRAAQNDMDNAG